MAFDAYGNTPNENKTSKESAVDFDALNTYVVETAQLEQPETLVGYVSAIIDLGMQEMPDAEMVFTGSEEDEAEIINNKPDTYFKNGFDPDTRKPVRLKCWPQKPVQCVTLAVDFPEIIVDKGQFFGESKPLPLRLFMGGQFYIQDAGMVVARPTPLRIRKNSEGKWSFDKKHLFHKMAVASKLIPADGTFLPQQIDQLLGKAFQFQAQVFFKENKGKKYYTENIKFVGGLGRGQKEPEHLTKPYTIQFNADNDENAIKELRAHIANTIKKAKNYNGSKIKTQFEQWRGVKPAGEANKDKPEAKPEAAPKDAIKAPKTPPAPVVDDMDSDCPF